jgi:hypothetical protein
MDSTVAFFTYPLPLPLPLPCQRRMDLGVVDEVIDITAAMTRTLAGMATPTPMTASSRQPRCPAGVP